MDNKNLDFIVLLELTSEQHLRMNENSTEPKWFGYPISKTNYNLYFTRDWLQIFRLIVKNKTSGFLVFNVDFLEVLICLMSYLLPGRIKICSLYQWLPFEKLNILKRIAYKVVINSSKAIVCYSSSAIDYLNKIWKLKNYFWIGLFTDTAFFKPDNKLQKTRNYFLCPGNHLRDECMVLKIANETGCHIIRYSNDPAVMKFYRDNKIGQVEFKSNLSFDEVKSLYNNSLGVLNVVDDTDIPAGITTFCEGLAMNKIVITPAGHSSSGYNFDTGEVPFIKITNSKSLVEWVQAIERVLNKNFQITETRTPRALAENLVSFNAVNRKWSEILNIVFGNS